MNIAEIVAAWLKEHGYDGLCNSELECGCNLEDLAPCVDCCGDCVAGYDHGPREGCDFWMCEQKPEPEDDPC